MNNNEISNLRKDYTLKELRKKSVSKNPFDQFSTWFDDAVKANIEQPNAMILATATKNGIPSSRVVLLKGVENDGFKFYTNYESQKGRELHENPNASLLFFWFNLERQIRISGKVEKVSQRESDEYFRTRPYESQLGAWASNQSKQIINREILEKKYEEFKTKYDKGKVPLPPYWGGFKLIPNSFEFWQGRENRLHDRIKYVKEKNDWKIERLSP